LISRKTLTVAVSAIVICTAAFTFAGRGNKASSTFNSISNTLPTGADSFDSEETVPLAERASSSTNDSLGGATSANQNTNPVASAVANRKIIRAAEVTMTTPDVSTAARRITEVMERTGGYLANQEGTFGELSQLRMEFRVPSLAFDRALGGLQSIGKIESANITSSEVTAQYVDLESRIKTLRAATERIRSLLESASRTEIVSLEGELATREAELASIEGQMNVLSDQVQLSRISVTVFKPAQRVATVVAVKTKSKPSTFGSAFRSSLRLLGAIGRGLMIALGAILPFFPLALVLGMAAMLFHGVRRNRQARAAQRRSAANSPLASPQQPIPAEEEVSVSV
jgi:Domain of unknown function (DUF4349)